MDINDRKGTAMNNNIEGFSGAMTRKRQSVENVVLPFAREEADRGFEHSAGRLTFAENQESRWPFKKAYTNVQELSDRLQKENIVLREEIDRTSMFEGIVGASPVLRTLLSHVSKVAPTNSTMLITGET